MHIGAFVEQELYMGSCGHGKMPNTMHHIPIQRCARNKTLTILMSMGRVSGAWPVSWLALQEVRFRHGAGVVLFGHRLRFKTR